MRCKGERCERLKGLGRAGAGRGKKRGHDMSDLGWHQRVEGRKREGTYGDRTPGGSESREGTTILAIL